MDGCRAEAEAAAAAGGGDKKLAAKAVSWCQPHNVSESARARIPKILKDSLNAIAPTRTAGYHNTLPVIKRHHHIHFLLLSLQNATIVRILFGDGAVSLG